MNSSVNGENIFKMIVVNARFLTQSLTGVQRFAYELSLCLKNMLGEEVEFLAPRNILQKEMAKRLGTKSVGRMSGYAWEQIELPLYLWKHGSPTLLNLCNLAPLSYRNNWVTIHDITWVRYPETYSRAFCKVYDTLIPRLCQRAKHIITVSEFSKEEIASYYGIPKKKLLVVYNAVSEEFRQVKDLDLREQKYFLAVSSLKANKNFVTVLKSFEKVFQKHSEVKLFIVGDCSDRNFQTIDIEKYKQNPAIKFLGRVADEELISYYSNAIGFVFPSLYEGFGIPVLEAQACGCPVISSSAASMPEVLRDSALFCEPTDVLGFAGQMCRLVESESLRLSLIEKGKMNVTRFLWQESAKKLIAAFEE